MKKEDKKVRFYDVWLENKNAYYIVDSEYGVFDVGFVDEEKAKERAEYKYESYRKIKFKYYDYDVIELEE